MKLVVSNTTKGAFNGVLKELKNVVADGGDCIVLTTDRMTATVERAILASLTDGENGGLFNIQVSSFTRLAVKYLGDKIEKCLTPEGSVMLLADVIKKKEGELKYYNRAARIDGFASEMYAALTALRNSGISSAALREKSEGLPLSLINKTDDLCLIYEGYLSALEGKHSDSTTRLEALAEYLKTSDPIPAHFFVIDFLDFKAPEYAVLEGLFDKASSLTIGAVTGFGNPNFRIYPDATLNKLRTLTKGRPDEVYLPETLDPVRDSVSRYLFSYDAPKKPVDNNGKIRLRSALNRRDEVLALAVDIVDKIKQGARFMDFEVLIGSEEYVPLIKSVFERYDLRFFIDKKEPLYEQTKVRYLLSALAVCKNSFRVEDVREFIKNPLFIDGLPGESYLDKEDKVFVFENYVLEFCVNHGLFFKPFDYGDEDRRKSAEEVRQKLIAILRVFDIKGVRSSEDWVSAAKQFLDGSENAWKAHVERLSEMSAYYKKCAEQVDDKIISVLDEIFNVLKESYDINDFDGILRAMLRTLKIALVPTFLDCVFVGVPDSRFTGGKYFYILGANAGAFPSEKSGGTVITPKDEEYFEQIGLPVTPDERYKIRQELFAVTEVIKKAKGTLTISYTESGSGGLLRPSSVIDQLKSIIRQDGKELEIEQISFDRLTSLEDGAEKDRLISNLFATESACFYKVLEDAVSGRSLSDIEIYRAAYSVLTEDDKLRIQRVYTIPEKLNCKRLRDVKTSVSRLETYFKCPYGYYLNYILGLRQREEGEMQNSENGTAIHYVLEKFFSAVRDGKVTEEDAECFAASAFKEFLDSSFKLKRMLEKPDTERIVRRLQDESVKTCLELYAVSRRSKYFPTWLEVQFEEGSKFKPISVVVDGVKIELRGKIDRVDVYDGKFIVIDYKTFKSADLCMDEVYYGTKLQLYIYAQALMENLDMRPSGVFYMPVFPSFVKSEETRYRYRGQMTDNVEEMLKMDSLASLEDNISSLPIKCDKRDHKLSAKVHLSLDKFKEMGEYAKALAIEGAKEISDGYIKPIPFEGGCSKCYYSEICPYRDIVSRKKSDLKEDAFCLDGGEDNE